MPDKILLPEQIAKEVETEEMQIGVFNPDGTIQLSGYQLKNIHEFVRAFYLTNMDELQ